MGRRGKESGGKVRPAIRIFLVVGESERQLGTEKEDGKENGLEIWFGIVPLQPGMENERKLSRKKSQLMYENNICSFLWNPC